MEQEHLIIIALILLALYMMDKSSSDKVQGMAPMGRIRYGEDLGIIGPQGHIRTREGYQVGTEPSAGMMERIRLGDRDFNHSQHVKQHIRYNNRNNMFSGMMGTGCGEGFRFTDDCCATDSCGAPC